MKVISCCIRKILTSQDLSQLTCHPSLPLSFCSLTASHRELHASPGMCLPLALYPSPPFSLTSLSSGTCMAQAPTSFVSLLLFPTIREPILMLPQPLHFFAPLPAFLSLQHPSPNMLETCVCACACVCVHMQTYFFIACLVPTRRKTLQEQRLFQSGS